MRTGNSPEAELLVGGQALIEGVMMRSPGAYGVAVLFQSLALGIRALNFSAEQAMAEEEKP